MRIRMLVVFKVIIAVSIIQLLSSCATVPIPLSVPSPENEWSTLLVIPVEIIDPDNLATYEELVRNVKIALPPEARSYWGQDIFTFGFEVDNKNVKIAVDPDVNYGKKYKFISGIPAGDHSLTRLIVTQKKISESPTSVGPIWTQTKYDQSISFTLKERTLSVFPFRFTLTLKKDIGSNLIIQTLKLYRLTQDDITDIWIDLQEYQGVSSWSR